MACNNDACTHPDCLFEREHGYDPADPLAPPTDPLDELAAAAEWLTPGRWRVEDDYEIVVDEPDGLTVADCKDEYDAKSICALRNQAEVLIAVARSARAVYVAHERCCAEAPEYNALATDLLALERA